MPGMTVSLGDDVIGSALEAARNVDYPTPDLSSENALSPIGSSESSWVERIWDQVEGSITLIRSGTREAAEECLTRAKELYADALEAIPKSIEAVRSMLLERLNIYVETIFSAALECVSSSLEVGGLTLKLSKLSVNRKFSLASSFDLSLDRAFGFTIDGSISLDAEYSQSQLA